MRCDRSAKRVTCMFASISPIQYNMDTMPWGKSLISKKERHHQNKAASPQARWSAYIVLSDLIAAVTRTQLLFQLPTFSAFHLARFVELSNEIGILLSFAAHIGDLPYLTNIQTTGHRAWHLSFVVFLIFKRSRSVKFSFLKHDVYICFNNIH